MEYLPKLAIYAWLAAIWFCFVVDWVPDKATLEYQNESFKFAFTVSLIVAIVSTTTYLVV